MNLDGLGLYLMPIWWAVLFIGFALLFRLNKKRTADGAKRVFFYLLILVAFGFFSAMPLGLLIILVPAMIALNFLPFLKGRAFVAAVVLVATGVSGGVIWQLARLADERDAFHPVVNGRFGRDMTAWLERVDRHAGEPLFQPVLSPEEKEKNREAEGYFLPDYGAEAVVFDRTERIAFGGAELLVPLMEGFSLRTERSTGSVALIFSDAGEDTFFVVLFGEDAAGKVVAAVRDSYARPEGYVADMDVLRELFAGPDYQTVYLTDGMIAQNSEAAIVASSQVSVFPLGREKPATFGYDLDVLAGAVEAGGAGMRVLMLSAVHDVRVSVSLPLLWLRRFLENNTVPRPRP